MHYKNIKSLIVPLIQHGKKWQYVSLNGEETSPRFYFSSVQFVIIVVSLILTAWLRQGLSEDLMGYIISAFSISVSLFMSLLVNIFDKFEKTNFDTTNASDSDITRLLQKKHFFKKFISITSYLVATSILIIVLCSLTYMLPISCFVISPDNIVLDVKKIDWVFTLMNVVVIAYRTCLLYFIMNYLLLTLFVTGSSFEYYISELDKVKILKRNP